jgi:uncharacterized spore protein YtfJ
MPQPKTRLRALRSLVDRLSGARLCYGEPVRHEDRTVIPVARVRASGGGGWGGGDDRTGGGGGGGSLDAKPIGFIEIGPAGTRFQEIADPEATGRAIKAGAAALATVLTAMAAVRAARGRKLLGRGH